jgi:ABC-type Mn2+/Zn2+ transport system permease subunit
MKVAVFCAGALGVRPWTLAGTLLVARTIRYFSLAYLGSLMGGNALTWINQHKWPITAGILIAAAAMAVLAKIVDQRSYPANAA